MGYDLAFPKYFPLGRITKIYSIYRRPNTGANITVVGEPAHTVGKKKQSYFNV